MSAWSDDELRRIADADELDIAAVRSNGELRSATPIWVVRAGDELYVRAAHGSGSGWYGVARTGGRAHITAGGVERDVAIEDADAAVLDAVDASYRSKYASRDASIVDKLVEPEHPRQHRATGTAGGRPMTWAAEQRSASAPGTATGVAAPEAAEAIAKR